MATISLPDLSIRLEDMERRCSTLGPVLKAAGEAAIGEIEIRFQAGTGVNGGTWAPLKFQRIRGGTKPLLDQGILRTSFTAKNDANSLTIGTAQKQAPLMNFGGTVVPKKGKFLTIPLTKEAQRAGSPRRMRGLSFRFSKDGQTGVMFNAAGEQWLMVKKVVIPARPFMGFSDQWKADFTAKAIKYIETGSM